MLSTGNPNKIDEARNVLLSTIIGLLIMLSAWLMVNTFMTKIGLMDWVGGEKGWFEIPCPVGPVVLPPPPPSPPPPPPPPPPPTEQILACIDGNLQLTSDKTSHIYIAGRGWCDAICKPRNAGGQNVECVRSEPTQIITAVDDQKRCKGATFKRAGGDAIPVRRWYCRVVPE